MTELVTLEQTKLWNRVSHDQDDVLLLNLIQMASSMVLNYLRMGPDSYVNSESGFDIDSDSVGYDEVPKEVQAATLYLIGVLYRDPDGSESSKWSHGYLPLPVISMLYPLREPALS